MEHESLLNLTVISRMRVRGNNLASMRGELAILNKANIEQRARIFSPFQKTAKAVRKQLRKSSSSKSLAEDGAFTIASQGTHKPRGRKSLRPSSSLIDLSYNSKEIIPPVPSLPAEFLQNKRFTPMGNQDRVGASFQRRMDKRAHANEHFAASSTNPSTPNQLRLFRTSSTSETPATFSSSERATPSAECFSAGRSSNKSTPSVSRTLSNLPTRPEKRIYQTDSAIASITRPSWSPIPVQRTPTSLMQNQNNMVSPVGIPRPDSQALSFGLLSSPPSLSTSRTASCRARSENNSSAQSFATQDRTVRTIPLKASVDTHTPKTQLTRSVTTPILQSEQQKHRDQTQQTYHGVPGKPSEASANPSIALIHEHESKVGTLHKQVNGARLSDPFTPTSPSQPPSHPTRLGSPFVGSITHPPTRHKEPITVFEQSPTIPLWSTREENFTSAGCGTAPCNSDKQAHTRQEDEIEKEIEDYTNMKSTIEKRIRMLRKQQAQRTFDESPCQGNHHSHHLHRSSDNPTGDLLDRSVQSVHAPTREHTVSSENSRAEVFSKGGSITQSDKHETQLPHGHPSVAHDEHWKVRKEGESDEQFHDRQYHYARTLLSLTEGIHPADGHPIDNIFPPPSVPAPLRDPPSPPKLKTAIDDVMRLWENTRSPSKSYTPGLVEAPKSKDLMTERGPTNTPHAARDPSQTSARSPVPLLNAPSSAKTRVQQAIYKLDRSYTPHSLRPVSKNAMVHPVDGHVIEKQVKQKTSIRNLAFLRSSSRVGKHPALRDQHGPKGTVASIPEDVPTAHDISAQPFIPKQTAISSPNNIFRTLGVDPPPMVSYLLSMNRASANIVSRFLRAQMNTVRNTAYRTLKLVGQTTSATIPVTYLLGKLANCRATSMKGNARYAKTNVVF